MKYKNIIKATFIERINRFVGKINVNGELTYTHIKNTGRCKELLLDGSVIYLEDYKDNMGNRKYRYSLIAVEKNSLDGNKILINIDSQAPNEIINEALSKEIIKLPDMTRLINIKREYSFQNSRFDFYIEDEDGNKGLIEVKGVTLENNRICLFPDAPTTRGEKHLKELVIATKSGFKTYIIFLIQMNYGNYFTVNKERDPKFHSALLKAKKEGVNVLAYNCILTPHEAVVNSKISIKL